MINAGLLCMQKAVVGGRVKKLQDFISMLDLLLMIPFILPYILVNLDLNFSMDLLTLCI